MNLNFSSTTEKKDADVKKKRFFVALMNAECDKQRSKKYCTHSANLVMSSAMNVMKNKNHYHASRSCMKNTARDELVETWPFKRRKGAQCNPLPILFSLQVLAFNFFDNSIMFKKSKT